MPLEENILASHEARLLDLWEKMIRTIGIHTVNVLVERAIWEASQKHPDLELIELKDSRFSFDTLNRNIAGRSDQEVSLMFNDLTTELLLILARLLGKEMALNLAEELKLKMDAEKQSAMGGQRE